MQAIPLQGNIYIGECTVQKERKTGELLKTDTPRCAR
jgi:hypothetical protein